jgi:hypothetical protein
MHSDGTVYEFFISYEHVCYNNNNRQNFQLSSSTTVFLFVFFNQLLLEKSDTKHMTIELNDPVHLLELIRLIAVTSTRLVCVYDHNKLTIVNSGDL